ncbi:FG-GAP repeat protein [bacterium]|nr:FG-GAP repeat protein [bacterium]
MKRALFAAFILVSLSVSADLKYLATLESSIEGDRLGASIVPAGDVNGDGYMDMLVCAEGSYSTSDYSGRVYLYLGGKKLVAKPELELSGEHPGDHFGASATALGDINQDGYDDFAISADRNDEAGTDAGKVYIYFGGKTVDDTADAVILGDRANNWFGSSISGGGDLNGDGKPDLLIGAPYGGRKYGGAVYLYLGDGEWKKPALVLVGENAGDSYGSKVAILGDVNGDKISDFAVSAVYADVENVSDAGIVYIYLGGSVISQKAAVMLKGNLPREQMGYNVCSPGDVTGDGVADILVGAPGGGPGGRGAAYLFSGGQVVRPEPMRKYIGHHQNDLFGIAISGAGDFNGDGIRDIIIGTPYMDAGHYHAGRIEIYPGGAKASTEKIYHINGTKEENQCGYTVAYIPDFLGKGKGIYAITCAGKGSGNVGKSRVLIYK